MNYFYHELKRAIFSTNFLLGNLLLLGSYIVGMTSSWSSITTFKGISFFLYSFSLGSGAILPVVTPLIISLPFSHSYLQDRDNNMIYGILTRTSLRRYFIIKILVTGLTASLTILLPLLLFLVINCIFFPLGQGISFGHIGGAWSSIFLNNQFLYIIILIIHASIFSFIYANVGLITSFFIHNKLVPILAPFSFYILPSFVFHFFNLDRFEPVTTFDLTANTASNAATVYGQLIIILCTLLIVGSIQLKKELILYDSNDN